MPARGPPLYFNILPINRHFQEHSAHEPEGESQDVAGAQVDAAEDAEKAKATAAARALADADSEADADGLGAPQVGDTESFRYFEVSLPA